MGIAFDTTGSDFLPVTSAMVKGCNDNSDKVNNFCLKAKYA
ncbi:hypothetical protein D1AOALGA4SA_10834 [Olavius algarvensis Delta 1 endosymbiont]|nr:hypothetical protein D1AOALGA4SA_10834 [Olavius algarvensis Delta 1 endosymbiont]